MKTLISNSMKLNKLKSHQKLTKIQPFSLPKQEEDYLRHLIHIMDLCYELSVFMSENEPSALINEQIEQKLIQIKLLVPKMDA